MNLVNLTIVLMILFIMGLFTQNNTQVTPQQITANISNVEDLTFNLVNTFQYKSMYNESNINTINIFNNLINSLIYPIVIQMNTWIPLTPYIMAGKLGPQVMTIIYFILIIIFALFLIKLIKLGIIVYFFIKEHKRIQTKWYQ